MAAHRPLTETYTRFSRLQCGIIITVASVTGLFSPLSSTLYVPAIPAIATEMAQSITAINLTITSYLVFQGVTPIIWASICDSLGRRLLYIIVLSIYVGSCVGLSLTNSYAAMIVLRALQSTGSASTSALGAGIISDLIHVSRRGGIMSNYTALSGIGTAFGPLLGGILSQYYGWHSIFLFLVAMAGTMLLIIVLLLPETHRKHVADGNIILPPAILQPPVSWLRPKGAQLATVMRRPIFKIDLLSPVRMMKEPDVLCCIGYAGITYTVWQMGMTATSTLYARQYGLNELQIGLTYISNGMGSLAGSFTIGRVLDHDYKRQLLREQHQEEHDSGDPVAEVKRIERARIRSVRIPMIGFVAAVVAFGWSVHFHAHISASIVLSFFVGGFSTCILAVFSTLVVDLFETKAFGATAVMNLSRCLISAAGTAAIQPMIDSVGVGWTFTILACICVVSSALVLAEWCYGNAWNGRRKSREQGSSI